MFRKLFTIVICLFAFYIGCSDAMPGSSNSSKGSGSQAEPAPGEKRDSTTRSTAIEGSIEFGEDVDGRYRDEYVGYTFEVSGEATVSARVDSGPADPAVWLFGPRKSDGDWGYEIAENRDVGWDDDNAEIDGEELDDPGTYLVVTGTEDWGDSDGPFTIRVECSGTGCASATEPGEDESGDSGDGYQNGDGEQSGGTCDRGGPGAGDREFDGGYNEFWVNTRTCSQDVCSSNVTMGPSCAKVALKSLDEDLSTVAYTNIRGSVKFTGLPDGEYVVEVLRPDGHVAEMMTKQEHEFGWTGRGPARRRISVDDDAARWRDGAGESRKGPVSFKLEKEGHEQLQTDYCCY